TPMTYRLHDDGRQFVVIAAGGHARLGSTIGDSVIAYALPENRTEVVVQSVRKTSPYVGVAVVAAFLFIAFRKALTCKWLWLGLLAVLILLITETIWLVTQSAVAMVVSFVLALSGAFLLMYFRGLVGLAAKGETLES